MVSHHGTAPVKILARVIPSWQLLLGGPRLTRKAMVLEESVKRDYGSGTVLCVEPEK